MINDFISGLGSEGEAKAKEEEGEKDEERGIRILAGEPVMIQVKEDKPNEAVVIIKNPHFELARLHDNACPLPYLACFNNRTYPQVDAMTPPPTPDIPDDTGTQGNDKRSEASSTTTEIVEELLLPPGRRCLPPAPAQVKEDQHRKTYDILVSAEGLFSP